MKKSFLLLISLILICGFSSVGYAEFDPVYFDFENYTTGTVPEGWSASYQRNISAEQVDELHGTSLQVANKEYTLISYTVPQPVDAGQFLISFEFYPKAENVDMLTNMGTSEGVEDHYLFRIINGEFRSADTSFQAWSFTNIYNWKINTWYAVDMLFDMDKNKLSYYIDGVLLGEEDIGFADFDHIICRTNEVEGNPQMCVDNFTFKYLSPGSFSTVEEGKAIPADTTRLNLLFGDLVNQDTLSNIKVFDLGTNPLAYSQTEIGYKIIKKAPKSVEIELDRQVGVGKMYKVTIDGVISSFGHPYADTSSYIATVGEKADKLLINADFSQNEATNMQADIKPTTDALWEKGGNEKVRIDSTVSPMSVNFIAYKTSSYAENLTTLTRTFEEAYTGFSKMEFTIKSVAGKHRFKIADSTGSSLNVIELVNGSVLVPGVSGAVCSFDLGEWHTFSVETDLESGKAKVSLDNVLVAENIDASQLIDFKSVTFENENYMNEENVGIRSQMYLASYTMYGKATAASITGITFRNVDGKTIYPEGNIDTDVSTMTVRFSDKMSDTSFTRESFKLLRVSDSGTVVEETISGRYVDDRQEYVVTLSNYLEGNSNYVLKINGVADKSGLAIKPVEAPFKTKAGVLTAKNVQLIMDASSAGMAANIIHTDNSLKPVYLIYAEYKNHIMINAEYKKITPGNGQRAISVNTMDSPYIRTPGADRTSIFVWDGFDTMIPLARTQNGVESAE